MLFRLWNAAQAFQRLMDKVADDLNFVFIYLDNILVTLKDATQHKEHLTMLFNHLEEFGMMVNPEKCLFSIHELEFLADRITAAGSAPTPKKVEAVKNFAACWSSLGWCSSITSTSPR